MQKHKILLFGSFYHTRLNIRNAKRSAEPIAAFKNNGNLIANIHCPRRKAFSVNISKFRSKQCIRSCIKNILIRRILHSKYKCLMFAKGYNRNKIKFIVIFCFINVHLYTITDWNKSVE